MAKRFTLAMRDDPAYWQGKLKSVMQQKSS
jgi:hypothetical protein